MLLFMSVLVNCFQIEKNDVYFFFQLHFSKIINMQYNRLVNGIGSEVRLPKVEIYQLSDLSTWIFTSSSVKREREIPGISQTSCANLKWCFGDFPGGPMVKNPPANTGDMGSTLVQEGSACFRDLSRGATTTEPAL